MSALGELLIKLALSAAVAVAIGFLDQPLTGIDVPWWLCAIIGLVLVFAGAFVIMYDDN